MASQLTSPAPAGLARSVGQRRLASSLSRAAHHFRGKQVNQRRHLPDLPIRRAFALPFFSGCSTKMKRGK